MIVSAQHWLCQLTYGLMDDIMMIMIEMRLNSYLLTVLITVTLPPEPKNESTCCKEVASNSAAARHRNATILND